MKVLFATSNKKKVENAKRSMSKHGIEVEQVEVELTESRSFDPEVIAVEKADQAFELLQKPVMVEDSGFFVNAIGEFPKTHVKFSLETLGINNILKTLEGVKDRQAEWRMCVAYASGLHEHKLFTFIEPGEIAEAPREVKRDIMSDYWRIYIPKTDSGNKLALSEMAEEDLAKWRKFNTERNQFDMLGRWLTEGKMD
ncbi:MAG: hypothetical protein NUV54_02945 [Candidatus Taylorbacteria bacterium]|nr:hypothetical protein [Candidatus Taylorbacteria bacterium]